MRYFTLISKYRTVSTLRKGWLLGDPARTFSQPGCARMKLMGKPGSLLLRFAARRCVPTLFFLVLVVFSMDTLAGFAFAQQPKFKVVAIAEKGGIHKPFVDAAKSWLAHESLADGFTVDYIENTDPIDDAFLSQYNVFIQLNYPPYAWTPTAMAAFQRYIEEGRGGWIGFHHATLLGEFDGYPMWPWFSNFMGGIRFTKYIPTFVTGTVNTEDSKHPVMKTLPRPFRD